MKYEADTPKAYIEQLPEERQRVIRKLRKTIKDHLPKGFKETMQYSMISYVVPHGVYPKGYHVDPSQALPFISIASQKRHVALYHMAIDMFPEVLAWFKKEYPKHVKTKLNMGKGCIRFTNMETVPYALIGELCEKISMKEYITEYEKIIQNQHKQKK